MMAHESTEFAVQQVADEKQDASVGATALATIMLDEVPELVLLDVGML